MQKKFVNDTVSATQKKNVYFDFSYDKKNQKFATTSGFLSNYSVDVPIVSDTGTLNNTYTYKIFQNYENNVSTASILLKSSFSINDNMLSERLFIPGNRLRGFERGKVGPKDGSDFIGGNYLTAINLAQQYHLFLKTLNL